LITVQFVCTVPVNALVVNGNILYKRLILRKGESAAARIGMGVAVETNVLRGKAVLGIINSYVFPTARVSKRGQLIRTEIVKRPDRNGKETHC
jgi:hypothetical protein